MDILENDTSVCFKMQWQTEIEGKSSSIKAKSCIATSNAEVWGGRGWQRRQREIDLKAARRAGGSYRGLSARRGVAVRVGETVSTRAARPEIRPK